MNLKILTTKSVERRAYWIDEISKISGNFGDDAGRVEQELTDEIKREGLKALHDHLRLSGSIPESYGHDSSAEKLYSKYTDILLAVAFRHIGFAAHVLQERGDSADVDVVCEDFSFIADAKAFRLSRTAKNQKDFKVQAMDGWKRDKPHAMIVCPIYQLPVRSSQIYQQAAARNVCILSYSHLSVAAGYAAKGGTKKTRGLVKAIFDVVEALSPSKDAVAYWMAVNRAMLRYDPEIPPLWAIEKKANLETIAVAKEETLTFLATERTRIMKMTHQEAITQLLTVHKFDNRKATVESVADNGILSFGA